MTLVLCSGGLDSTVMLHMLAAKGGVAEAITFNYGQKHVKEIDFAKFNCAKLGIPLRIADISNLDGIFGDSALTSKSTQIPEGHYEAENMKSTVVPNRNMVMISVAAARAISAGCDSVAYAAHSGDHVIYPDCRDEFADALERVLAICHYTPIKLLRPFIDTSKADIVKIGARLGVDFSKTWSCYKGGEFHCGKCGTCVERREAFRLASIADPTIYEE